MMEPYVSFFVNVVLDGVAPPEGFLKDQFEGGIPESATEETAPIEGPQEEWSTPQAPCKEQTTRVETSPI